MRKNNNNMFYFIKITYKNESILHICDDSTLDLIRVKAIKAIKNGHEVMWYDKTINWTEVSPILDFTKDGSDMYIWDKTFNKVKNEILLYTKKGETVIKEKIGERFKTFV